MTAPQLPPGRTRGILEPLRERMGQLSPRQRQYGLLFAILGAGIGLLWLIFALTETGTPPKPNGTPQGEASSVTNVGILPAGAQVNPVDQWLGTAGRKLAQYESEREEQGRLNKDRQTFEARTMQRFAELEQRLTSAQQGGALAPPEAGLPTSPSPSADPLPAVSPSTSSPALPPAAGLPPPPPAATSFAALPPGAPPLDTPAPPPPPIVPVITRVSLGERSKPEADGASGASAEPRPNAGASASTNAEPKTVSTYLPVSFTRGRLLGGLDAPTGGQSQANPHPVLIRLSDNSVLPNRFRGEYRECFVVAAGYGDISSERAYLRTESLSCVRADGATLEVRIQGSVYGEDGKVGMRGRLVTKQGQMLANALLAGVVSGIGQGLSTANTTYSTTPLGSVASTDSNADAYRAGLGSGVGKALDRLAQYYIKLAENTFPVIEVDAGREIDVVITKGVRIDVPMNSPTARSAAPSASPETRYLEVTQDEHY